jgi:hypothetical protein
LARAATRADDAHGAWWISVYDQAALNRTRAGEKELEAIAVPRVVPKQPTPKPSVKSADDEAPEWTPEDIRRSRAPKASPSSSGTDRVYVRGYTRKDGTYVRPYTRSAPRHR